MRVDKISFASTSNIIKEDDTKGFKKPLANLMDSSSDSFESASKGIKHNSGLKRLFNKAMMGLGVIGIGLGTQACDPTDIPVDPPVKGTELLEKDLAPAAKVFMVSGSDSKIPLESQIHDSGTGYDARYEFKNFSGDTAVYNTTDISNNVPVGYGETKIYKNTKGNYEVIGSYSPNNIPNDPLQIKTGITEYIKQADGSFISKYQNIEDSKYIIKDELTVVRKNLKHGTEALLTSVKKVLK